MALPNRPLSIKDACTTARSIAQEVDGNITGDKSLCALGVTAGITTPDYAMSEFEGYSSSKSVSYYRMSSAGACGSPGPVTVCSCLLNSPVMTSGEQYDACICWILNIPSDTNVSTRSCVNIKCNGTIVMQCVNTSQTLCSGLYNVATVDYNDAITMCVYALAGGLGSVACGYSCLHALTNMTGSFVVSSSTTDQFVVATT